MDIKNWFKTHFNAAYKLQIIGFLILQLSFVFMISAARLDGSSLIGQACPPGRFKSIIFLAQASLFLAAVTGFIDYYIIYIAKQLGVKAVTITRWFRDILPKKIDTPLMIFCIIVIGLVSGPLGWLVAAIYLHGFLNDHFNEERL